MNVPRKSPSGTHLVPHIRPQILFIKFAIITHLSIRFTTISVYVFVFIHDSHYCDRSKFFVLFSKIIKCVLSSNNEACVSLVSITHSTPLAHPRQHFAKFQPSNCRIPHSSERSISVDSQNA